MEQPAWKQDDVFPMIARIVRQASDDEKGYISAHSVATRLLQDAEAAHGAGAVGALACVTTGTPKKRKFGGNSRV